MRIKIFVDFWNLQISWNEFHKSIGSTGTIKIPWGNKLTDVLLSKMGSDVTYAGTHIYASVNPLNPSDNRLRSFLESLNMYDGYKVIIKDRKSSKSIFCNNCQKEILVCPHCNETLKRTIEKGIDTAIAIELFQSAVDNVFDKAILISGDADFIPAIDYIQQKGKIIVHAGWKGKSYNITKSCFSRLNFDDLMTDLLSTST